MYAIYKQSHPPTGIEHCVYCNFFKSSESNLVVAAVNQIHVYRLNPDSEVSACSQAGSEVLKLFSCSTQLSEHEIYPTIVGILTFMSRISF